MQNSKQKATDLIGRFLFAVSSCLVGTRVIFLLCIEEDFRLCPIPSVRVSIVFQWFYAFSLILPVQSLGSFPLGLPSSTC